MAKLVDALALGASGAIHGGSSPLLGTNKNNWCILHQLFLFVVKRGLERFEKIVWEAILDRVQQYFVKFRQNEKFYLVTVGQVLSSAQ